MGTPNPDDIQTDPSKEAPYSSDTSFPRLNADPLVVDQGFPLDEHGWNLARDWIEPVIVPYYFSYGPNSGVANTTEYTPITPGIVKSDGPTPASQYSGIPGYAFRLDLTTGLRTEYYTGNVLSPIDSALYQYYNTYNRLLLLAQNRDITQDILNLWGTKPWFKDDWFKLIRPTRPPNPRVDW